MPNPPHLAGFIYGLHDIGGQELMIAAQRPGWLLDAVDLTSHAGGDYSSLNESGICVLVRLDHSLENSGTIPPSTEYDLFASRCADYAANSLGAHIWIIGNEMNHSATWPKLADGSREIVTPAKYAQCFLKCRTAIQSVPGHASDWVIPGAVAPQNCDTAYPGNPTGDWVQYLVDLLNLLGNQVDGLALHCYTHDFRPEQIPDEQRMHPPFEQRRTSFRSYRDFLEAVPAQQRTLPVFITECSPLFGWRNSNRRWIQSAYEEIDAWNADLEHQPIQAVILYRWKTLDGCLEQGIQDKPALIADFQAAQSAGYRVRWPATPSPATPPPTIPEDVRSTPSRTPAPPPPPSTLLPDPWAAVFSAHDTPVSMAAGQMVNVNLQIHNAGANPWLQSGPTPVHLGYKWFTEAGEQVLDVEDRRTGLPVDLPPNQDVALGAVLVAPRKAGTYYLRWDLVAEGLTWFADAGNPPLVVPVFISALPRDVSGWRVESNMNPAEVAYALDGDPRTFWDSHTPQSPGQWFRLNLAAPRMIDGIQFLSPGKAFPSGYILRVSADGFAWTEVARATADHAHDVMAVFAPVQVQFAQLDLLTAPASQVSWMISEILVHPATIWTPSASHNGQAAGNAADNRGDTVWSTEVAQVPGMWFQLDLGRAETVSGLTLLAPSNEHPASFRIATWNARASRWQIAAEKSNNQGQVNVTFPARQTQFINIQLLDPADRPWAIRELRIIREMETWLGPGTS